MRIRKRGLKIIPFWQCYSNDDHPRCHLHLKADEYGLRFHRCLSFRLLTLRIAKDWFMSKCTYSFQNFTSTSKIQIHYESVLNVKVMTVSTGTCEAFFQQKSGIRKQTKIKNWSEWCLFTGRKFGKLFSQLFSCKRDSIIIKRREQMILDKEFGSIRYFQGKFSVL